MRQRFWLLFAASVTTALLYKWTTTPATPPLTPPLKSVESIANHALNLGGLDPGWQYQPLQGTVMRMSNSGQIVFALSATGEPTLYCGNPDGGVTLKVCP